MKVHLLHIGKTGGSAIKNTLKDKAIMLKNTSYEIETSGHDKILGMYPGYYAFFVRDPVKRFVSGFISRLRKGYPLYDIPHSAEERKAFQYFATPNQLAESLSSDDLGIKQLAIEAMNSIFHIKYSINYYLGGKYNLSKNLDKIIFVGRTEYLDEDFYQLLKKLDMEPVELSTDEIKIHKTPKHYQSMKYMTNKAICNLIEWYKEDYEMIDYLIEKNLLPTNYKNLLATSSYTFQSI